MTFDQGDVRRQTGVEVQRQIVRELARTLEAGCGAGNVAAFQPQVGDFERRFQAHRRTLCRLAARCERGDYLGVRACVA